MSRFLAERSRPLGPGKISGRLYDLGAYPGMKAPETAADWVTGDVVELLDPEATLPDLDRYEGYPRLFDRVPTSVTLENGASLTAWVYLFRGPVRPDQHIPSGIAGASSKEKTSERETQASGG
jgi:gamma-glutamylcyclotransferase (GGCT)/AIG2-like uncharacterized protein YtfP